MDVRKVARRGYSFHVKGTPSYRPFWDAFCNAWEDETFDIFGAFLRPDKIHIDIGTWIGPTVLSAATKSKQVFGIEPDRQALAELTENIGLNPELAEKITIDNKALSSDDKPLRLYLHDGGGDSMSSLVAKSDQFYDVDCISFAGFMEKHSIRPEDVGFIKVDIEGGEYHVLAPLIDYMADKGMEAVLYVSLHRAFCRNDRRKGRKSWQLVRRFRDWISLRKLSAALSEKFKRFKYRYDEKGRRIENLDAFMQENKNQGIVLLNREWKR